MGEFSVVFVDGDKGGSRGVTVEVGATEPTNPRLTNPVPIVPSVRVANPVAAAVDPNVATREEAAYQGIMASLPTFVKKSIPANLTDDKLDGITTYFSIPHDKLNILPIPRPNKVPENRCHKKWFFACGGMTIGVPYIWTFWDDAKSLPTPTAEDMNLVAKISTTLPQNGNKFLWYAFCDETTLVKAGLVYDKVFDPEDITEPPT
ncbi:hypothetical protein LIER_39289 [Lithospermum erythrorhizon]|uniref:Uncharacterized protein n=1 Tax=Lithospermum erythrorhizon TaxID=34254 RepID=A0AAV3QCJ4_LITER